MARLFFLLSGEHQTLPFFELEAILKAEGHKYLTLEKLPHVLRLEASVESLKSVINRSAMTRVCGLELFNCQAQVNKITKNTLSNYLEGSIEKGESFAVRIRRVRRSAPNVVGEELEKKQGELILKKFRGTKVHLNNPDKTYFGILTQNKFVFGLKLSEVSPKTFVNRKPRKRPFFHPASMPSKLARCMVNLAQPKTGDLVLDPFCGTASMLIEAGLIGCRVAGLDAQRRMVRGSLQNLMFYSVEPEGMAVADARHLPIDEVDCVVTDPPYGRSSTTMGSNTKKIVEDFFSAIEDTLPSEKRMCIASPKAIGIGILGREHGFTPTQSHYVYVHRSLTREITVFKRV